jgi:hypothetical protein
VENVPAPPWGTIAAVVGTLVVLRLALKGTTAVATLGYQEARYRLCSGRLPTTRWG